VSDLTQIIVTWNNRACVGDCLESLCRHPFRGASETIVVDNASTDGTAQYVADGFPDVRVLRLERNRGFAAGNNVGLRIATGRYVLLLNPDTVVHAGALDALVGYADAHSEAWAVGPRLLGVDGASQRTGVKFPSPWSVLMEALFLDRLFAQSRFFGAHRELYEPEDRPRRVDYLQGSCLLLRAAAIARVGILDEDYFLYFEETDWCRRCRLAGGEVHYAPGAVVTHLGGGGDQHYGESRLILYHESLLRYCRKHMPPALGAAMRVVLVFRSVVRLCLWLVVALTPTRGRGKALSSVRGYVRVLLRLFGAGSPTSRACLV